MNEKHSRPTSTCLLGFLLFIFMTDDHVASAVNPILPAMGRPALLGEFYDARNQSFLGVTIFRDDIPPEKLIKTIDTTQSDIKYGIVDSTKSKVFHLDASAEIKVEMMSGKLKVSGSAAYFNEEKKSALEVEGFLQYKTRTKRESLNLLYDKMKPYLKLETLSKIEATHIVIAIEYGADVVIKFLNKVDNKEEQFKIQGALELSFTVQKISIGASASVNLEEQNEDAFSNFSLNVYGDINLGSRMPQNMKDVMSLIHKVPEKLKENNDGKGVPMIYTLFPISILAELVNNDLLQQKIVNDLDEAILNDFVKMFDKISRIQQELNDFEAKVKYYSNCTSREDVARVETLNSKFSDASLQLKLEAREAMDTARTMTTSLETAIEKPEENLKPTESPVAEEAETEKDESESENQDDSSASGSRSARSISQKETRDLMKKVLLKYQSGEFSVDKVAVKLETDFEAVLSKIELYKVFQRSGVEYFGRFGSFNNLRLQTSDKILYAIFMINSEGPEWENNWELFLNQLKRPFSHLAIADCAFKEATCTAIKSGENKTVMRQYYRAKMISKDVYADLTRSKIKNGERPPIIMSAVGRFHEIGDLYNARAHQFTTKSLLLPGTNLTKMNMTIEDFSNETMEIVKNGFDEKFEVMNVQPPALQYNILLNPKGLQGVGRTFMETRGFQPQWVSHTLHHVYNTISESILDVDEESFDFISISRLLKGGATHFVKQIVWGGQTTVTLSAPLPDGNNISSSITGSTSNANELLPKLRGDLVKIWDILMSKSKIEFGEAPAKISKIPLSPLNYEIKFASDIFQNARNEFRTEKDLVDFLNEFPRLQLKANKGKGRPVLYVLYPLENLKYFGVIPQISDDPFELENSALSLEFARGFEAFNEAEEKIKAMKKVFNNNKLYITDETLDDFLGIERSFQRMKRQLLDKLRGLVKDKNEGEIKEWVDQMKEGASGVKFFNATGNTLKFVALDKFSNVVEKLEFFQYFSKEHPQIKYFGRENLIRKEMTTYTSGEFVYMLFYRMEIFAQNDPSWVDNFDLMTRHLQGKPYNKLILMDCDFEDESCKTIEKSVIRLIRNTHTISENVLEEWNAGMSRLLEKKVFTLQRRSIGQQVHLGALYNAKSEKLLDKNILNVKKIQSQSNQNLNLFIMTPALEKIEVKTISSSDLTQRYTALKMAPEVQLAYLFQGQEKDLEASAGFLDENLEFSKATIFTVEQHSATLNLDAKDLPEFFQSSSLDGSDGPTHYVKQIKFGSNTVFALGQSATDEDVQFLEKKLGSLEVPTTAAVTRATLHEIVRRRRLNDEAESRALTNLERLEDFKIFTDLALQHQVKVIKGGNLTDLVHKISLQSKTYPFVYDISEPTASVSFILEPLESLQRPLGILSPSYKYQPLPETFQVAHVIEKYQAFQRAVKETGHLEAELLSPAYKIGMSNSSLEKIEEIHHALVDSFTKFKIRFRDELEAVKNGSRLESETESTNSTSGSSSGSSESKLKDVLNEFKDVLTVDGKYSRLEELKPEQEKLKFLKYIADQSGAQSHVTYLGRDRNFNDIVFSSAPTKYVLYFKNLIDLANDPLWLNTTDIFFKLGVQGEECFIIDCDFPTFNCTDLSKPTIHQYQDGVLTSSDYAATVVMKKNQTATEMDHQQKWLKNLQDTVDGLGKTVQVEQAAVETIRGKLNENLNLVTKRVDQVSQKAENFQNSMVLVQENLSKLESVSVTSLETLHSVQDKLNDSLVPIGFIYIQYMKQPSPQEMWPQFVWSDMSKEYAGLFFRTEGNDSLSFDGLETQEETSPRIRRLEYGWLWGTYSRYFNGVDIKYDTDSAIQRFSIGEVPESKSSYRAFNHIEIKTTGNVTVIPRNQAIRIWKRVANSSQVVPSYVDSIIRSDRTTHWGTWGSWQFCPAGQFVIGFQLRREDSTSRADNTGLNAISLFCHDNSLYQTDASDSLAITSKVGDRGVWGSRHWCENQGRVVGFLLEVQRGGEIKSNDTRKGWGSSGKDELGATDFRVHCTNETPEQIQEQMRLFVFQNCPSDTAVCGMQTQVEDYVEFADNTALNNVDVACCNG